jgi:hypothetical protein
MKYAAALLLLLITATSLDAQTTFRRGNGNPYAPRYEFNVVDNFDNSPLAPTYSWADTTYGTWTRVTGWSNNDDGVATLPMTYDSINFLYFNQYVWVLQPAHPFTDPLGNTFILPGTSLSTNASICLLGRDSSPVNTPLASLVGTNLVAPLWADWELRSTGDSSKVYVHVAAPDSFYVSYYNLGLKGTNGKVRATFQVLFCAADSSITFRYKSFDGSWNGVPAAALIQRTATIGLFEYYDNLAVLYLHKGNYFATGSTTAYNQPLQNGLAVRFFHTTQEAFEITTVTMPPNDRYENSTNIIAPACRILNTCDSTIKVFVQTTIANVTSGTNVYSRSDSIIVENRVTQTYTAPQFTNLTCGSYKVTFTISYRNGVSDYWSGNNTFTRYFVALTPQLPPFRDEIESGIQPCTWSNSGAEARANVMYVPAAPHGGVGGPKAIVLDRLDAIGAPYPLDLGGDTLTSAPIDLSNATTSVGLSFHYQRGLNTDSSKAGVLKRIWSGPEAPIRGAGGGMAQMGDTLVIEGLKSTGAKWNPAESDWGTLATITGGFDTKPQTMRIALSSTYVHDHFRVRFRIKSRDALSYKNFFEDADNFAIDAVHVEPFVAHKTELEPIDVDLGNGIYTHVPRDLVGGLQPKVRIRNNGDGVEIGLSVLHLTVIDALGRAVYDRTRPFSFPSPLTDSIFPMPAWDIHGTQGGTLTAYATLQAMYYDSYNGNDTNVFIKTMSIDDTYALDDGAVDTVGSTTSAPTNFYYDFKSVMPSGTDSLRGIAFYMKGAGTTSWSVNITWPGGSASRGFAITSAATPGWYRATFTPFVMYSDTTYRFHFAESSGPTNILGGDASNGLIYPSYVDSNNSANNQYVLLHPDVLGNFYTSGVTPYTQPLAANGDDGGYALPMFRLVTSGSSTYLPVQLVSIGAQRMSSGQVAINWKTAIEDGITAFEIARAESHAVVGMVSAKNIGADYLIMDETAPRNETTYILTAINSDGSRSAIGHVMVGAADSPNELAIKVYPNPASNSVMVLSSQKLRTVSFIDPTGRTFKRISVDGNELALDVATLPAGAWYIVAESESSTTRTKISIVH